MRNNIILNVDSYKLAHWLFYPEGTQEVYSYAESRGGKYPETLFFGMQGFIREFLLNPFVYDDIVHAAGFAKAHGLPFNALGWERLWDKYHLPPENFNKHCRVRLPLEIKAVPEGSLIPTRNALVTVRNTDPEFPWLTSYVETAMLRATWYATTVATRIFYMKRKIKKYFDETSDEGNMDFALLDFSSRGCAGLDANQIGGSAYLSLFKGSDSIPAIVYTNKYYNSEMSGFSVPATEHSIMTSYLDEGESIKRIIEQAPENSILSIVGDTWNIFNFCHLVGSPSNQAMLKQKNITLVVRPDSGDIFEVLPKVLHKLLSCFGATENKKGFDVLNGVKVLWGDGINEDTCVEPFRIAKIMGISADSIMTGSGGGLMQANIDRDTCKFAYKASNVIINGESRGIAKDPITDPGKKSKTGKLMLVDARFDKSQPHAYRTIAWHEAYQDQDILRTVFKDGELLVDESIDVIRERINSVL